MVFDLFSYTVGFSFWVSNKQLLHKTS